MSKELLWVTGAPLGPHQRRGSSPIMWEMRRLNNVRSGSMTYKLGAQSVEWQPKAALHA